MVGSNARDTAITRTCRCTRVKSHVRAKRGSRLSDTIKKLVLGQNKKKLELANNVENLVQYTGSITKPAEKQAFFMSRSAHDKNFESDADASVSTRDGKFAGGRANGKDRGSRTNVVDNVERTDKSSFRRVAFDDTPATQTPSVSRPLSGLRSRLHNSEDAFTSADMFASWVRVRSKRNGPLSWMRVPGVGGGKGTGKVGSRRSLRGTPLHQLITNSGHRCAINPLTPDCLATFVMLNIK